MESEFDERSTEMIWNSIRIASRASSVDVVLEC